MSKRVLRAADVEPRGKVSHYPAPFAERMGARVKRRLGDALGLSNFGVNQTTLGPGAQSALRHCHSAQDELIYILEGTATLYTDNGATTLEPGMCAGFPKAAGDAHHLINEGDVDVVYLEIGDRSPDDTVTYPDDDLAANLVDDQWRFSHKDGQPY